MVTMSDPNINQETGETMMGRSPRFTMWVAFLVFATITMGSAVEVKNAQSEPNSASKWAIACSSVTFALTVAMVAAHLVPLASTIVIGTRFEGIIIFMLACFWAATVSIVTNASNGLGVSNDSRNQVVNGNLYYFSWSGFVTAIVLLVNYLRQAYGLDVLGEVRNRAARLSLWAGMLAGSMVVTFASVRVLNEDCQGNNQDLVAYCRRTKFGISVGAIGIFLSVAVVGMKVFTYTAPFLVEFAMSILLVILNAFSVAYITSPSGPGSPIGNLYYFSWISFLCAAMLFADCFNQKSGPPAATDSENKHDDGTGDIEVENLDDQI